MFGQVLTNLGDVAQSIREALDWDAPRTDAKAKNLLRNMIRESYLEIQAKAPTMFLRTIRVPVDPDLNPPTRDTISVWNGDAWVVEQDLPQSDSDASVWNDDRLWDARMILITDEDTQIERPFRLREVWFDAGDNKYRATLDRPYPDAAAANLTYRILSTEFPLPDNILRIKSAWVIQSGRTSRKLQVTDAAEIEHRNTVDYNTWTKVQGEPRWIYSEEKFHLPAPKIIAADNTAGEVGPYWVGPEPRGLFEYVFTYVWGEHELWLDEKGPASDASLTGALRSPYFESGPSPVARAAADQEYLSTGNYGRVVLTLPDLPHMLAFNGSGSARENHVGLRKRVYRRRVSNLEASPIVETGATFYLIDEVPGNDTTWADDGSRTPDYYRPFRPVSFYHLVEIYPRPGVRGELRARVVMRPPELVDDTDVPQLPHNCISVLRELAKAKALRFLKEHSEADRTEERAWRYLKDLLDQSGSIKDHSRTERLVAGAEEVYPGDASRVVAVDTNPS